ncbi:MAG TPA: EamA family transporter [Roseomonas sp.]
MHGAVISAGGETGAGAGAALPGRAAHPGGAVPAASAFSRLPPPALMLLAIVSVQLGAALATVLFSSLGATGTAFATSLLSAAVLTLIARPRALFAIGSTLRRHFRLILLFGLVDSAMVLPFFLALERIPLGIASTVTFLGPLGLAVATSRRLVHFLWIGIAAIGVALLTPEISTGIGTGGLDPIGLLYAAIGALGWAAFVPMSQRVGAVFPGHDGLALGLWASAAMLLPFALFQHGLFHAGFTDLLGALGVSLLGTVLPMALEFRALQRMSARTYGILVTLEPAVGALVGMLCLGQPASPRMVVAVVCVMLAALGVTLSDRRE